VLVATEVAIVRTFRIEVHRFLYADLVAPFALGCEAVGVPSKPAKESLEESQFGISLLLCGRAHLF
jgi:hypothetical protein